MPPFKIFVDLDGVLVNFEKLALEVAGVYPEQASFDKKLRSDFWKKISAHVRKGNPFFAQMELMDDAMELWEYVKHHSPTICSATGHLTGAAVEKRSWVRKYLGHETADSALFVRSAPDKAQFAAPHHILIDDRCKAIDPWIAAGGVGVLHTSARDTIQQLRRFGL